MEDTGEGRRDIGFDDLRGGEGGRGGWVSQSEQQRESGLHAKVDWEEGGLEGCELGAGEGAEGDYSCYEGLEDFGAKESAIAE